MPPELQIIRAREFIRLGARGHFDLSASRKALAELARALQKRGIRAALLDLRSLRPGRVPAFSLSDLAALVQTFRQLGFNEGHHLAVLYSSDPHRRARLFAFLGKMHGWNVGAFDNFEHALVWLAGEEMAPLKTSTAGERVLIKRHACGAHNGEGEHHRERCR